MSTANGAYTWSTRLQPLQPPLRLDEEIARHRHHPFFRLLGMGALAAVAYVLLRAVWPMLRERMECSKSQGLGIQGHTYRPPAAHSNELLE